MPRRTLVFSLFLVGLLLLQVTTPIRAPSLPKETREHAASATTPPPPAHAPLGVQTSFQLNVTSPSLSFGIDITQPGAYSINASFRVDSAGPGGIGYDILVGLPYSYWIPMVGDYVDVMLVTWDSRYWYGEPAGATSSYYDELVAVNPDTLVLTFDMTWGPTPTDRLSGNFTVSQRYSFASAPTIPLGTNGTLEWTQDDTWKAARFTLPSNGLYNLTAYAGLDWTTTAGWPGDMVWPFDRVELIDLEHGEMLFPMPYAYWYPAFIVPPGPGAGSDLYDYGWHLDCFAAGDYYLVGRSDTFEYLNSTALNFTLNIKQVLTVSLAPNSAVPLHFSTTSNVYDAYVAVSAPQGYYYDLYFENPVGANWSVFAWDAVQGWPTGPYLRHTENPTQIDTWDERLERSWSTAEPPAMMMLPMKLLVGNPYTEQWLFQGTYKAYDNGTLAFAWPPGLALPPPTSRFATYFLHVTAAPYGGTPTDTFDVSLALDATPFPTLTTSGLTLSFNTTTGVFYHILQMPETSGNLYTVNANATKYTTSGEIAVEDMFGPTYYADWQWLPFLIPLGKADPMGWWFGVSFNASGPATLHYAAVRDGTSYLMIHGPGMVGGDMTEAKLTLTVKPPTSYTLGDDASASLVDLDLRTYSLSVVAGYSYALNLSIDWDGYMAVGYFFNDQGYSPFIMKGFMSLYITVSTQMGMFLPFGPEYYAIFTAKQTGTITFAIVGTGTVHFSIQAIEPYQSGYTAGLQLGLLIAAGGIIAAAIICFLLGWALKRRRST